MPACLGGWSEAVDQPQSLPKPDLSKFETVIQEQLGEARSVAEAKPEDVEALARLAMLYHAYELGPEAAAVYERLIRIQPERFQWPYLAGHALLGHDQRSALKHLRRAVELEPDYAPAQVTLANAHLKAGEYDDALMVARAVRTKLPNDPMVNYTLGMIHFAKNEPLWAIQFLKPVLDSHPQLGGVRAVIAKAFKQIGQQEQAESYLRGWKPNQDVPRLRDPVLIEIYRHATGTEAEVRKGLAFLGAGEHAQALEHFEKALSYSPGNEVAATGRIDALMGLGKLDRCEKLLNEELKRNPDNLAMLLHMGHLSLLQGKLENADSVLQRAFKLEPGNRMTLSLMARLAMAREDYQTAIQHLKVLLTVDPRNADAWFQMGRAYALIWQSDEAERAFRKATEIDPTHPGAAEARAQFHAAKGESDEAAGWYRRAYEGGCASAACHLHTATYAVGQKAYADAREVLEKGLYAHPGDLELADMLACLYALCPDAKIRDAERALNIAKTIYGEDEAQIPDRGLNTLAAAHAEAADFTEAIRLARIAVQRAKEKQDADMLRQATGMLRHYQQGRRLYQPLLR